MSEFASAHAIIRQAAEAFRPPRRMRVSEAAAATMMIVKPSGSPGLWDPIETPYMVEPMDMLTSAAHEAVCFVGPARTGKTAALIEGWINYAVKCDPGDMLVVQMSMDKARDYSKTRVDRMLLNSPALRDLMSSSRHDDTTFDKMFRHGMWLKLGWPSPTQLASSDYRYAAWTDYDRVKDHVGDEGSGFMQMLKRTTTYMSRGMALVESSPGRDIVDPHWHASTRHEAPPVSGILGIYNKSDRRRWYWRCPDCSDYFEAAPGLKLFSLLPSEADLLQEVRKADLMAMSEHFAKIVCPCCTSVIEAQWKPHLNDIKTARWVPDGQSVDSDGELTGTPMRSSIAGYWMGGVAATYQSWQGLILRELQALRDFALSGDMQTLKTTRNTDQGVPFLSPNLAADREGKLEDRAEEIPRYIVPQEARFLTAQVDIQGGVRSRFEVEIRAWGLHLTSWVVDRFVITSTERDGVAAQVNPGAYVEDWDLLIPKVLTATYRLTHEGREMRVLRVGIDAMGEAGVTEKAVAWYKSLRKRSLSERVRLLHGEGRRGDKAMEKPMVLGNFRDNKGRPMKDMPLWRVDTDYYKDIVDASLRRKVPGPGYFQPAKWLPASYYEGLRAEVRDAKGHWKKLRNGNEPLDHWVYGLALCEELGFGAKGRQSWDAPPAWALPQDQGNSEVVTAEQRRAEKEAVAARVVVPGQPAPATARPRPAPNVNPFASDEWMGRLG